MTLEKLLYVESVEITDKVDCCPRDRGVINVIVSTSETDLDSTCTGSADYGKSLEFKVHCSPPARGRYLTIKLIEKNVTLVLCQVVVNTIGESHLRFSNLHIFHCSTGHTSQSARSNIH